MRASTTCFTILALTFAGSVMTAQEKLMETEVPIFRHSDRLPNVVRFPNTDAIRRVLRSRADLVGMLELTDLTGLRRLEAALAKEFGVPELDWGQHMMVVFSPGKIITTPATYSIASC